MRHDPGAPNGMTEFLIAGTAAALKQEGVRRLSMNFAVWGRLFEADVPFTATPAVGQAGDLGAQPVLPDRVAARLQREVRARVAAAGARLPERRRTCRGWRCATPARRASSSVPGLGRAVRAEAGRSAPRSWPRPPARTRRRHEAPGGGGGPARGHGSRLGLRLAGVVRRRLVRRDRGRVRAGGACRPARTTRRPTASPTRPPAAARTSSRSTVTARTGRRSPWTSSTTWMTATQRSVASRCRSARRGPVRPGPSGRPRSSCSARRTTPCSSTVAHGTRRRLGAER